MIQIHSSFILLSSQITQHHVVIWSTTCTVVVNHQIVTDDDIVFGQFISQMTPLKSLLLLPSSSIIEQRSEAPPLLVRILGLHSTVFSYICYE